uniref:NFKB inhibitor interacting Ras like 2 n=2 Tax=Phasianinae TaxID=9072 RepID=A0A8C9FLC2_PAVCR
MKAPQPPLLPPRPAPGPGRPRYLRASSSLSGSPGPSGAAMITSHSAAAAILPPGRVGAERGGARGRRKGRGFPGRRRGLPGTGRGGAGPSAEGRPRSAAGGRCGAAPLPPPRRWGPRCCGAPGGPDPRPLTEPRAVPRPVPPRRCSLGGSPACGSGAALRRHGEELQGGGVRAGRGGQNRHPGAAAVRQPRGRCVPGVGAGLRGSGAPRHPSARPAGSEMIETQEDIYVGSIETDRGVREQVRFYDTRGLRDGLELPKHCFSCTDGYVLVYSTDSKESFKRVELLKKEIDKCKDKKEVTIVVLGNKCDLQEQRRVDHDAAQHWAKGEKVKLWEVSVADRRTLIEPFIYLASKMTQPQSKSAFPLSRKNKGSGSVDG